MQYLELIVKLRKVMRSINLESKKIEKEFGVSIPQILVLKFLSQKDGNKASSKEIKEYVNLNASTISGIIARLEDKGLVKKLANKEDKRGSFIQLTAKGVHLLHKSPVTLEDKFAKNIEKLNKNEREGMQQSIDVLINLLNLSENEAI